METQETTKPLRWTKWWPLPPHSGMSLKEKGGACHTDHCHTNYLVLELKQWCDYLPPCHHQISEFECLYCSSLLRSLNQAMAWRLTISSLDTLVEVPTSATFPLGNLVRVEIYLAGMSVHLKQWIFLAHFPLFLYSFNLYVSIRMFVLCHLLSLALCISAPYSLARLRTILYFLLGWVMDHEKDQEEAGYVLELNLDTFPP